MKAPEHLYVEHPTYTGEGCAICGKGVEDHAGAIFDRVLTKAEIEAHYRKMAGLAQKSEVGVAKEDPKR